MDIHEPNHSPLHPDYDDIEDAEEEQCQVDDHECEEYLELQHLSNYCNDHEEEASLQSDGRQIQEQEEMVHCTAALRHMYSRRYAEDPAIEMYPERIPAFAYHYFEEAVERMLRTTWLDHNMCYMVRHNLFYRHNIPVSTVLSPRQTYIFATVCQSQIQLSGNDASSWYQSRQPWADEQDILGIVENCGMFQVGGICIPRWLRRFVGDSEDDDTDDASEDDDDDDDDDNDDECSSATMIPYLACATEDDGGSDFLHQ